MSIIYYKKKAIVNSGGVGTPELIVSIDYENNAGLRAIDTTGFATTALTVSGTASISTVVKYGSDAASLLIPSGAGVMKFTSSKTLNPATDSYTIGGWVCPSGGTFQYVIGAQNDQFYPLEYYSGSWYIGDGNINVLQKADTLAVGTWFHIAMSHDASTHTYRLFKNGIMISSSAGAVLKYNNITAWEIGARSAQLLYGRGNYGRITINKGYVQVDNFTPT